MTRVKPDKDEGKMRRWRREEKAAEETRGEYEPSLLKETEKTRFLLTPGEGRDAVDGASALRCCCSEGSNRL